MSRLPIRVRLTAAFALAMVVVLAVAGLFVFVRLRSHLDAAVDATLRDRAATIAALEPRALGRAAVGAEAEESFAQRLARDGRVLRATGGARQPALSALELGGVTPAPVLFERRVAGIEDTARVRAQRLPDGTVLAVGESLDDRDDALSGLLASFAVGAPLAVVLASAIGYALAAAALRPVEAMRRRAADVSLAPGGERLPLPAAGDEIRRLGETLNAMLDRLAGSFARERRFVSDASHELRTPIAVVKAELEAALCGGALEPQVREALAAALEECDRLAQLAEDLLVLARAGEGALPVRREALDVGALLDGVRRRFAQRAAQRGRSIRVAAPDGLRVSADPVRLGQALGNLVDNALRHGEGEVVLAARADRRGVELVASDAGPGFEPQIATTAFERFSRGDRARGRGGTGLGMAIVRAVAEAHGGSAAIVPGPGASVRIWLPGDQAVERDLMALSGAPPTVRTDERSPTGRHT